MRRLIWQLMVSLDGFIAGPNGELDWHAVDDDFFRYNERMFAGIGGMLLGRRTYEAFAGFWPTATGSEADAMNGLEKIVFSRTLDRVDWVNARLVSGDAGAEVRRVKQQPGKDLSLLASADLAATFLREGLIDEIRAIVNPVLLGGGTPMWGPVPRTDLRLTGVETSGAGLAFLTYEPA